MDENMAADVLTGTDASAEGADFDGLFDMDGEVTAEPQERRTGGRSGNAGAGGRPSRRNLRRTAGPAGAAGAEPKYKVVLRPGAGNDRFRACGGCPKGLDYDNVRARLEQAQQARPPCSWWSGTPRPTA
ncbi:MAG: hypothetical protein ACLUJ0_14765 [Ruthenibacterium lactatiformans]|uniref:hypothetical protein n=1 Tax=Ruthenibacterium lactatiformans TaxID=1550024 RepID=UPI00399287A1